MTEFGKRKSNGASQSLRASTAASAGAFAAPASAAEISADNKILAEVVATGRLPRWTKVGASGIVLTLLLIAAGFYYFIVQSIPDLARDYRYAGTWRPAYDMQAILSNCTRINGSPNVSCDAVIRSRAEPNGEPIRTHYETASSSETVTPPVPVRSSKDPTVVALQYTPENQLGQRAFNLLVAGAAFAVVFVVMLRPLLAGRYKGGAAHARLLEGLAGLRSPERGAPGEHQIAA